MKRRTAIEKWKGIVSVISSNLDCMNDAETNREREELRKKMYEWLMENYQVNFNQETLKKMRNEKNLR